MMSGKQSSRDEEGLPRDKTIKAVIQEDYWNNGYHVSATHQGKVDLTIFSLNSHTNSAM